MATQEVQEYLNNTVATLGVFLHEIASTSLVCKRFAFFHAAREI